jgi:hypothetical protein
MENMLEKMERGFCKKIILKVNGSITAVCIKATSLAIYCFVIYVMTL